MLYFLPHFRSINSETSERAVVELQQQLHEKDMKLTDIRLEALSSAHQLEQLRDTMNRMKVISFEPKRYGGGVFYLLVPPLSVVKNLQTRCSKIDAG